MIRNSVWPITAVLLAGCTSGIPTHIDTNCLAGDQPFRGIILILMPNKTAYYYVSDGGDFRWMAAAREPDRIRPYCSRTVEEDAV